MLGQILLNVLLVNDPDYIACWTNKPWLTCTSGPFVNLLGEPVVGLLLVLPTTIALWMQSGSIYVPAILLTLLVGTVFGGVVPAGLAYAMYAIILVALTLAYRSIPVGRT